MGHREAGRQQVSMGTALLAALVAAALGASLVTAVAWDPTPSSLSARGGGSASVVLSRQIFEDPQPVELNATLGPSSDVLSTGSGVVTAYECQPGGLVVSGEALARTNDAPVVALATSVPMWRPISSSSTGRDVDAIHRELQRLALIEAGPISAGSVAGQGTIDVLAKLAELPSTVSEISATAFAWIPRPWVKISTCLTTVGAHVAVGTPLITLAPQVIQISLKATPNDAVQGPRVVQFDGIQMKVGRRGIILSPSAIRAFSNTGLFNAFLQSDEAIPLQATWALKPGVRVAALPASAIVARPGVACVSESGVGVRVKVVASQLGKTYALIDSKISRVDASPAENLRC